MNKHKLMTEARLTSPPAERLVMYVHIPRLEVEKKSFLEFIDIDLAHTVMLVEEDILSREDGQAILKTLKEIRKLGPDKFPIDPTVGSFLLQVEAYLFDKIGEEIGGKMHTGRSRIDQTATVIRLKCRDECLDIMELIVKLQKTLLNLSRENVDTITVFRTHLQHAQPSTFGHYLLSFIYAFDHDFHRLKDAYGRTNLNPLGTAASVGTSWPLNRFRTTELLGFNDLVKHARRSYTMYDYVIEIISHISLAMSNIYDLATDLYMGSTYEFRTVETADEYCGSSSIMPQKKNPTSLEMVRRIAGKAIGFTASSIGQIRTCGTADATRGIVIMDDAFYSSKAALDLMQGIMETLVIKKERMLELARSYWSTTSNLADVIVREAGLSFRQAHHVVGRLVRNAIEKGLEPADITTDLVDIAADETIGRKLELMEETISKALDPEEFVRTRVTLGSCSPTEVQKMIVNIEERIAEEEDWLSSKRAKLKESHEKLEEAVENIIGVRAKL